MEVASRRCFGASVKSGQSTLTNSLEDIMDKEEKVAVTTSYLPAVETEHHGPESALPARIEDAAMADPTGAPQPSSQLLVTTSSKNQQPKERSEEHTSEL